MRKLIIFSGLAAGLAPSVCNTVDGMDKDARSAGTAVEQTADDAKKKM